MYYSRGRAEGPTGDGPDTVHGLMSMDTLLKAPDVGINGVVFQPGSRTHWHSHTRGQIFIVSFGRGVIATRAGDQQIVEAGDVVYTPPNEEHWHGATPDTFVAYTAISLGKTEWSAELLESNYLESFE